jgi:hypothetical protein
MFNTAHTGCLWKCHIMVEIKINLMYCCQFQSYLMYWSHHLYYFHVLLPVTILISCTAASSYTTSMCCSQFLHHLGALLPVQRSITLQSACRFLSFLRACCSREREAPSLEIHDTVSLSIRLHNEKTAKLQPALCIPAVVTMFGKS